MTNKNKFKIKIFDMRFKGEYDMINKRVVSFTGGSKGKKYEILYKDTLYELIAKGDLAKPSYKKDLDDLKENVVKVVSFVNDYTLIPLAYCKQ